MVVSPSRPTHAQPLNRSLNVMFFIKGNVTRDNRRGNRREFWIVNTVLLIITTKKHSLTHHWSPHRFNPPFYVLTRKRFPLMWFGRINDLLLRLFHIITVLHYSPLIRPFSRFLLQGPSYFIPPDRAPYHLLPSPFFLAHREPPGQIIRWIFARS